MGKKITKSKKTPNRADRTELSVRLRFSVCQTSVFGIGFGFNTKPNRTTIKTEQTSEQQLTCYFGPPLRPGPKLHRQIYTPTTSQVNPNSQTRTPLPASSRWRRRRLQSTAGGGGGSSLHQIRTGGLGLLQQGAVQQLRKQAPTAARAGGHGRPPSQQAQASTRGGGDDSNRPAAVATVVPAVVGRTGGGGSGKHGRNE